ncbi:MAG: DEAD/DEAH box helicase family protein [Bacteroidales bacterium]|nr:DEAD/DEAH box helicase family protein [Bacteroidales bacterium]
MKPGLKLIDNTRDEYQLGALLRECLLNPSFSEISIASGYWDLPGMADLLPELDAFLSRPDTSFRLILGEEPSVKAYQVRNPQQPDPDFPGKYLGKNLEELDLKEEYARVVRLLSSHLKPGGKVQIRVYRKGFLHAKCYLMGRSSENAIGLIGSSNFTRRGLSGNLELNQLEDNNSTVNFIRQNLQQHPSHRSWFESLWNESEEWSGTFKEEILDVSKHGDLCFSAYEMYIHALYKIYLQDLQDEKESKIDPDDPASGKPQLLKFQVQNANSCIRKLERQGVAMLSDSVGLGKTFTAIKVIEYYQKRRNQRVVVIAPAGLIPQWRKAFDDFRIVHIPEIYSLQDVNKTEDVKLNLKSIPVGLFVFDESHNLRSSGGQRFRTFIDWRQKNENAHTLLVTATPINNQLSDLTNQIMLGSGGEIHQLGRFYDRVRQKYVTLQERLDLLQTGIKTQIREKGIIDYQQIKEQLTPLLNRFIIRRTRQGIEKEYPDGLLINGRMQKFPMAFPYNLEYEVPNQFRSRLLSMTAEVEPMHRLFDYTIDSLADLEYLAHPLDLLHHCEQREKPVSSSLEILYSGILALGFPCYRYNIYRHAYYKQKRGELELNVDENRELSRQIGIYGIFRTIFLKRLESSLYSIRLSLAGYEKKLLKFKENLEKHAKIISIKNLARLEKAILEYNEQQASEDELDFDVDAFELEDATFTTLAADPGMFNLPALREDIAKDLRLIRVLKDQLELLIDKDHKIKVLADKLDDNEDAKVLIFTYYADTLAYLSQTLPGLLRKHRHIEFATGTRDEIEQMARRFAPVSKRYTLKREEKEIDYLVATDKLSEGQNLQDCGIIINYDLHWNPVRMIQRNGRINRLGSAFDEIHIFNFRPTEQLESYLKLVRKLEEKINLIRYTIGSDQSVLDEEPIPQDFTEDLYSRDEKKRFEAFKKIFDTTEWLAAEDLFMDDLREFDRSETWPDSYKQLIQHLPKGKWGKIQLLREQDDMGLLVHLQSETKDAGYFIAFNQKEVGELISTTEGLLRIKATSSMNTRFKDPFSHKPVTEAAINRFIATYQFSEEDHKNKYTTSQEEAVILIRNTMIGYGYPLEILEQVSQCIMYSQNAFIKKETMKLVRLAGRLNRNKKTITSELIEQFIELASQYKPGEKSEKAPLSDILQIFMA